MTSVSIEQAGTKEQKEQCTARLTINEITFVCEKVAKHDQQSTKYPGGLLGKFHYCGGENNILWSVDSDGDIIIQAC